MNARIETILKKGATQEHTEELKAMLQKIETYTNADHDSMSTLISRLRDQIQEILTSIEPLSHSQDLHIIREEISQKDEDALSNLPPDSGHPPEVLEYIEALRGIRSAITHKDSSQK